MTTVGGLFHKYSSVTSTQVLCEKLKPLLDEIASPKEVKCTKRVYLSMTKHLDTAVASSQYASIATLFKALSYVANGSRDHSSGFHKFITFGLPDKILSWFDEVLSGGSGEQWGNMVDSVLFSLTVVLGVLTEEDQQDMVPLLTPLLACVCSSSLPCTAKIEAARGSNILLEVCSVKSKTSLTEKSETKQMILSMGRSIQNAGNFELQVSIVECLYRLTSAAERASLATKWFNDAPSSVIQQFTSIREAEFEVDCRAFLNELNSSVAERTVCSLSCMRLFCGAFELHCPQDASHFWVDFNTGSRSVTVFVDDPALAQAYTEQEESIWEMIAIKESAVVSWSMKVLGGEYVLSISLKDPAHSLLPGLSSSSSHEVTIQFNSVCDPTSPTKLVFGASKQSRPTGRESKASVRHTKQSSAIQSVHINQRSTHKQAKLQEISPIEAPPDTPALGGHVNSQGSSVTPNSRSIAATPATSTPKLHQLKPLPMISAAPASKAYTTPSSSGRRPPLTFVSSGTCLNAPRREGTKSSMAVNSVLLNRGRSTVIRTGGLPVVTKDKSTSISTKQVKKHSQKAKKAGKSKNEKDKQASGTNKSSEAPSTTPTGWTKPAKSGRKRLSQLANFRALESPEDVDSPVLEFDKPTAAVLERLQSQQMKEEPLNAKSSEQSKLGQIDSNSDSIDSEPDKLPEDGRHSNKTSNHSTPVSALSDLTNRSVETDKPRKFNLSGVSAAHTKKSKSLAKKCKPGSRSSSLNSTQASEDNELSAIPDSLPAQSVKLPSPKPDTKAKRKPLKLNLSRKSLCNLSESEDELDGSYEPSKESKELSKADKPPRGHSAKPVPTRSSTRQLENKKNTQKTQTRSGIAAPAPKKFKSQLERQQFIDEVYGDFSTPDLDTAETVSKKSRKRIIDEVYDSDVPDTKASKTKPAPRAPQKKSKQVPASKSTSKPPKSKSVYELSEDESLVGKVTKPALKILQKKSKQVPASKSSTLKAKSTITEEPYDSSDDELTSIAVAKPASKPPQRSSKRVLASKPSPKAESRNTVETYESPDDELDDDTVTKPALKPHQRKGKPSPRAKSRIIDEVYNLSDDELSKTIPAPKPPQRKSKQVPASKSSKLSPRIKSRKRSDSPLQSRQTKERLTSLRKPPRKSSGCNQHSSPVKTYGRKGTRKRVVEHNNSDFDDLLLTHLQTKKHCPEPNCQSDVEYPPSPAYQGIECDVSLPSVQSIQQQFQASTSPVAQSSVVEYQVSTSPAIQSSVLEYQASTSPVAQSSVVEYQASTSPAIRSPVVEQENKSIGHAIDISGSDEVSIEEPVKNRVLNTQKTEKAHVPKPPKKFNRLQDPKPPSSSVSMNSSQITADLNITAGFQEICRALISKSGVVLDREPKTASKSHQARSFPKTLECEAELSESEEESVAYDEELLEPCKISLTQLTRDIVNSHQLDARKGVTKVAQPGKNQPIKPKSTQVPPEKKLPPPRNDRSLKSKPASMTDCIEELESDDDMLSETETKSSVSYQDTSPGGGDIGHENSNLDMCDLMNLFGGKLPATKRVKQRKSTSKNNEELLQLWCSHQDQRERTLSLHQDQLYKELEVIEKDVQRICDTEKHTMHVMRKREKAIQQSIGSQQKQVDRIRTLNASFHQHLSKVEESQNNEQLSVRRSLKQEMHSLQKKLLVDYERKEVSRIKQSLHAMLLQVS